MNEREATLPAPTAALSPLLSASNQTTNIAFKQVQRHTLARDKTLLTQSINRDDCN